jgi:G3E family GTPase
VVVNKTDLAPGGTTDMEAEIRKINPFAELKHSIFCNIDFELGDATLNKFYFGEVKTMPRPEVYSMVIKTTRQVTRQSLQSFLEYWAAKAYRIKGFVKLKGGGTVAVQCTFDSVNFIDVENDFHPTELIALTEQFTLREWNKAFRELN